MNPQDIRKLKSVLKRLAIFMTLAITASLPIPSQTASQTANAEQEVRQLDRELIEARRSATKGDITGLDRILADDFIATSLNGRVTNKAQYIKSSTSPQLSFTNFNIEDVKVRVYGDAAVVTGRTTVKGRYEDQEFNTQFRYTRVYLKRAGRWQIVTSHLTPVTKQ